MKENGNRKLAGRVEGSKAHRVENDKYSQRGFTILRRMGVRDYQAHMVDFSRWIKRISFVGPV